MQIKAANSISLLLEKCVERLPCPNPKIFKNLCSLLCADPSKTPDVTNFWIFSNPVSSPVTSKPSTPTSPSLASPFDVSFTCNKEGGIITLLNQHKVIYYIIFHTIRIDNSILIFYYFLCTCMCLYLDLFILGSYTVVYYWKKII